MLEKAEAESAADRLIGRAVKQASQKADRLARTCKACNRKLDTVTGRSRESRAQAGCQGGIAGLLEHITFRGLKDQAQSYSLHKGYPSLRISGISKSIEPTFL